MTTHNFRSSTPEPRSLRIAQLTGHIVSRSRSRGVRSAHPSQSLLVRNSVTLIRFAHSESRNSRLAPLVFSRFSFVSLIHGSRCSPFMVPRFSAFASEPRSLRISQLTGHVVPRSRSRDAYASRSSRLAPLAISRFSLVSLTPNLAALSPSQYSTQTLCRPPSASRVRTEGPEAQGGSQSPGCRLRRCSPRR